MHFKSSFVKAHPTSGCVPHNYGNWCATVWIYYSNDMISGVRTGMAIAAMGLAACDQAEIASVPHSPPDLELVSAGNEPRRVLMYKPAVGAAAHMTITIAMELTAGDMGGAMPTLELGMTSTTLALMPTGHLLLRTTIDSANAEQGDSTVSPRALTGPLEVLKGLAIRSLLAPNGRISGSLLDRGDKKLGPELEEQISSLVASFDSIMMTLPDEPVGAGAVWRNSRPVAQNGLALKAVNSVSLTSIKGDVIEYAIDTDIHGDDQSVKQGELTIMVKDVVGNGGGKGTIDLAHLAITSELAAEFRAEMSEASDTQPTKMKMATRMRVQPR